MYDAWGTHLRAKDYDAKLVKKLIRQRRLAPLYIGGEGGEEGR